MTIKENFFSDIAIPNAIGISFLLDVDEVLEDVFNSVEMEEVEVDIEESSTRFSVSDKSCNQFMDKINSALSTLYPNVTATECDYDINEAYIFVVFKSSDNFIFDSDFVFSVYDILVNSNIYVDVNVSFDFSVTYADGFDDYEYWGAKFSEPAYEIVEETYDDVEPMSIIDIIMVQDMESDIVYEK